MLTGLLLWTVVGNPKAMSEGDLIKIVGEKGFRDELVDPKTGRRVPIHDYHRPGGLGEATPDQLRLAFPADPRTGMTISWVTHAPPTRPFVRYAVMPGCFEEGGSITMAHVTNLTRPNVNLEEYVMRAELRSLAPGTTYCYTVGDFWTQQDAGTQGGFSGVHTFRTIPDGGRWAPNLLMMSDLAVDTALPAALMTEMVNTGKVDAVFHLGDIAYSLVKNSGTTGDRWMRTVAPFAASVPYMVTAGDHDLRWGVDFWDMQQRFAMPGWRSAAGDAGAMNGHWGGLWWSVDIGPVHIASYNTEAWANHGGRGIVRDCYRWLRHDLRKANANRDKVPWIVTVAHTPMYTSGYRKRRVKKDPRTGKARGPGSVQGFDPLAKKHREGPIGFPGYNESHPFPFEKLLHHYRVDMSFQGHWHNYERFLPAYNQAARPGPKDPYTDPQAVVHVNIGHAGRGHEPFDRSPLRFSAKRAVVRGFGVLTPKSDRELEWTAYGCDYNNCHGNVQDHVVIRKTRGGETPYTSRGDITQPPQPAPPPPPPADPSILESLKRRLAAVQEQVTDLRSMKDDYVKKLIEEATANPDLKPRGGFWQ